MRYINSRFTYLLTYLLTNWAIDPSLLLVHVCGTLYQFIDLRDSELTLLEFRRLLKTHICLPEDRGA